MEYTVKFKLHCISKRNLVSWPTVEIDISTDLPINEIKKEEKVIKDLIYTDVHTKVKQKIFEITILDVVQAA